MVENLSTAVIFNKDDVIFITFNQKKQLFAKMCISLVYLHGYGIELIVLWLQY